MLVCYYSVTATVVLLQLLVFNQILLPAANTAGFLYENRYPDAVQRGDSLPPLTQPVIIGEACHCWNFLRFRNLTNAASLGAAGDLVGMVLVATA
jgi:hypothetical protein